ncbi:acyltransferase family protein [Granulicella arctica]|uniref:acyltransferase family protein n=1 Tax=Granulicella arctica TaxID=940613 RepID=UPI0021E04568|nr:acyltransferase [Granulicella arctica]
MNDQVVVRGHVPALDGVRGLAILLVFLFHSMNGNIESVGWFSWIATRAVAMGWTGVDLFFVLSGYLITRSLWPGRGAANYYRVFYGRRALRIFPLYYAVLIGVLMVAAWRHAPYSFDTQILFWLNLSNLATAFAPSLIGSLSSFWSLAIEEQFYFIWPSILRHINEKYLVRISITLILIPLGLRNLPTIPHLLMRWPDLVYRLTFFRVDTLAAGALLAFVTLKHPEALRHRATIRAMFWGSGLLYGLLCFAKQPSHLHVVRFGYTLLLVCFTSLVALSLSGSGPLTAIFSNKWLRRMGDYSYCFYLLHIFPIIYLIHRPWIRAAVTSRLHLSVNLVAVLIALAQFGVTFALCALSYHFIEHPLSKLKKHFKFRRSNENVMHA